MATGGLLVGGTAAVAVCLAIRRRHVYVERNRTRWLQSVTAALVTSELPERIRFRAVSQIASMLGAAWCGYLAVDGAGELRVLAVEERDDNRLLANRLPIELVVGAIEVRQVMRRSLDGERSYEVLVLPTGDSEAIAVLLSGSEPKERDIEVCTSIALVAGAVMRSAEVHRLEHRMAETLQRQALPTHVPTIPGWDIAAAYQPAVGEAGVGGDWYKIFESGDGRIVIAVGDIVGHGVNEAGAMGQIQMAVRALAEVLPPDQVLEHLDHIAPDVPGAEHSSILCMEVVLESDQAIYSSAGFLPPLLIRSGRPAFLWDGRGPIVGIPSGHPRQPAAIILRSGDRILLYTDGLIEKRTRTIDDGLAEIAGAAIATLRLDSRQACDRIMAELVNPNTTEDDVALIVITIDS